MNVQGNELEAHMTTHKLEGIYNLKRKFSLAKEEAKFGPLGLDPPWHAPHTCAHQLRLLFLAYTNRE